MTPSLAAIALGTNLSSAFGGREENLREAVRRLADLGNIREVSTFSDTEPVGYADQPRFLNAALLLETGLQPLPLLHALLAIEQSMGRRRNGVPAKGPRIIDLDLLWFDDLTIATPELTLPHPALAERLFVLEPLSQVAPDWVHPRLGKSIQQLLVELHASQPSL